MNKTFPTDIAPQDGQNSRTFPNLIHEICQEDSIACRSYSFDWIFKLSRGDKSRYIIGYQFDLNPSASAKLADDKAATSDVFASLQIPHVEHQYFANLADYTPDGGNWRPMTQLLEQNIKTGGLVIKDNSGSSGNLVFRARTQTDLEKAVSEVFRHANSLSLSPFEQIAKEYRIIMLDDESRLIFEKVRAAESEEWRHNLAKGASAKLETDLAIANKLTELAKRVAKALNLRFASVDIIENARGELKIMEINSGVMMEHLANQDETKRQIVKDIYRAAIQKMLES